MQVQDFIEMVKTQRADPSGRWQERANCLGVDPDLFFPERGASTREAKGVCKGCEVRLECLEYAAQITFVISDRVLCHCASPVSRSQ